MRVDRARHHRGGQRHDPDDGGPDRAAGDRGVPRRDRDAALLQGGHLGPRATRPRNPSPAAGVRLEIDERVTSEGTVDRELDEEGVRKATARLRAFGVTSIAVCFLHSYLNPSHELRAREIILDEYPDVELISLSHEVWPKPPEFERTSTTLVNAFVGPPIVRYLDRLEAAPARGGLRGGAPPRHQLGRGGHPRATKTRPLATISFGPDGRGRGGGGCRGGSRAR